MQYARFADDMVILIDSHPRNNWLVKAVDKRLREELAKLRAEINEEKTRMVNLTKGDSFGFLGFEYFDSVQHNLLLEKVARRVQDAKVMRLLNLILKSWSAIRGVMPRNTIQLLPTLR